ncbi:hypothetical protein PGB90_007405 [Kerria lacca]
MDSRVPIITASSCLELTLAMIKPHATKVPYIVKGVQNIIISNDFYIVRSKQMTISPDLAEAFYKEHKDKFFYNRLITLMSSGISHVYILARQNAIKKWREIMGPTKVFKAKISHPHSIRGQFGLTDTRNVTHGSDSVESFKKEVSLLFPEFNVNKWYETEEIHFRSNNEYFESNPRARKQHRLAPFLQ